MVKLGPWSKGREVHSHLRLPPVQAPSVQTPPEFYVSARRGLLRGSPGSQSNKTTEGALGQRSPLHRLLPRSIWELIRSLPALCCDQCRANWNQAWSKPDGQQMPSAGRGKHLLCARRGWLVEGWGEALWRVRGRQELRFPSLLLFGH